MLMIENKKYTVYYKLIDGKIIKKSLTYVTSYNDLLTDNYVWGIFYDENKQRIILPIKKIIFE